MGAGLGVSGTAVRHAALLAGARTGDVRARDELIAIFYEQWRRRAHRQVGAERPDPALQATAVLHEALIPLLRDGVLIEARSPALLHFAVGRGIRQVLARHARDRGRKKRGGGRARVAVDEVPEGPGRRASDIRGVARELEELAGLGPENERRCEALRLSVWGGYGVEEIASLLDVSGSTVEKDLRTIKALLRVRLDGRGHGKGGRNPG